VFVSTQGIFGSVVYPPRCASTRCGTTGSTSTCSARRAGGFGATAERLARFFGTPKYLIGQTLVVIALIAVNAVAVGLRWDPPVHPAQPRVLRRRPPTRRR
jgi:hypothetical protein